MNWVDSRTNNLTTSYVIESDSNSINVCRPFEHYVNHDSEQIIELGTQQYQFKNINFVFIDLFNRFSNSNISFNVHVMENTYNYLPVEPTMLINITSISIGNYSEYYSNDPRHALFVVTDSEINIQIGRTLFNIIQNTTMNSLDTNNMEQVEAEEKLGPIDYVMIVNRCNLRINNFDIYSQIASGFLNVNFILPIRQFSNRITHTNINLQVKGTTSETTLLHQIYMPRIWLLICSN